MTAERAVGESEWAYESIIRSVPWINTSRTVAVATQLFGFEAAVLILATWYELPGAAIAGTVGVIVSVAGSIYMLWVTKAVGEEGVPPAYRQLLYGSQIEIPLGLVAFFVLLVYVFVYDPRQLGESLLTAVLGDRPPLIAVFIFLVLGWDVAYRIGVGWWSSIVGLWRSYQYGVELPAPTRAHLRRLDAATIGYASVQLLLVPVLAGHPLLQFTVVGHTIAVAVVSGTSILILR